MDISLQKDFNVFVEKSTLYLIEMKDGIISCHKAKDVTQDIEYLKYRDHMKYLRKDIFPSPTKNENMAHKGFQYTIDRLSRLLELKKLFCRFNCYYVVKKSFTEGVQWVEQDEIHSYKAIGRPLDIFISKKPLEPKTFRYDYDFCTESERISPGYTKNIPPNTYYVVIAPCHTCFKKEIRKTSEVEENPLETAPPFAIEENHQGTSVTGDKNGFSGQINGMNTPQLPSGSRDVERDNSSGSFELVLAEPQMVIDNASTSTKRSSTESNRKLKRARSSTPKREESISTPRREESTSTPRPEVSTSIPWSEASTSQMEPPLIPVSPSSLERQLELFSNPQTTNGTNCTGNDHGRAVFAIRKDGSIESYAVRPNSTFQILHDNIMTGSFTIENEDMDPNIIEYHGDVQFIREVAKFKNGSTFETTLTVQKDLLNELRDSTRKKEKIVVNYFFEYAFKTIEAAYKKFSEMRHTRMIGSCVPAIVPLSDARFFGAVSDVYEAKP